MEAFSQQCTPLHLLLSGEPLTSESWLSKTLRSIDTVQICPHPKALLASQGTDVLCPNGISIKNIPNSKKVLCSYLSSYGRNAPLSLQRNINYIIVILRDPRRVLCDELYHNMVFDFDNKTPLMSSSISQLKLSVVDFINHINDCWNSLGKENVYILFEEDVFSWENGVGEKLLSFLTSTSQVSMPYCFHEFYGCELGRLADISALKRSRFAKVTAGFPNAFFGFFSRGSIRDVLLDYINEFHKSIVYEYEALEKILARKIPSQWYDVWTSVNE